MNDGGFLRFAYAHILEEEFANDERRMAAALRVSENTLHRAVKYDGSPSSMLFWKQLLYYCAKHGVSVDRLLSLYVQEMDGLLL